EREHELSRTRLVNEGMATALQHGSLTPAPLAVANAVAVHLHCDRVTVGFEAHAQVRPLAMSPTASFDARSDLARTLGDAMDEGLDLGVAVVVPVPAEDELGAIAHAQAARVLQV